MNSKLYKPLLYFIFFEFIAISFLSEMNVQIQSWIGNVIGIFVFFIPIELLFFLLGSDERFPSKKQILFKAVFWFIIVCCLLSVISTLIILIGEAT